MLSDDLQNALDVAKAQRNGEVFSETAQDHLFTALHDVADRLRLLERMAVVNTSAIEAADHDNVVSLADYAERKANAPQR